MIAALTGAAMLPSTPNGTTLSNQDGQTKT
jgi:hypothetical protein